LIVDTSALLALFNSREPQHAQIRDALAAAGSELLVVSPYVLAELDYLVATRVGVPAELAVLAELSDGGWELPPFDAADLKAAAGLIAKYADQEIGLADASQVVLARRYATRTIATLDRKHFSVLKPMNGGRFTLLP